MKCKFWAKIIPVLCCSAVVAQVGDPALSGLAEGIQAYQRQDYATAAVRLASVQVPQIADYVAYYLAAARVELKQYDGIAAQLAAVHQTELLSPLAGKAWLLEAKALESGQPAEAVRILREHFAELPQPDGNLALGEAYTAANDLRQAAEFYQRVDCEYVVGDAAQAAEDALAALKARMGANFPKPQPEQSLHRAARLLEARNFGAARAEYQNAIDALVGEKRDRARVLLGRVDLAAGKAAPAMAYLRGLELPEGEADAERLYWELECARRLDDEPAMSAAAEAIARQYPHSSWRRRASLAAASHWLAENRPDLYLPLYQAVYENFPGAPEAAISHWKVVFHAYLGDDADASQMLREHIEKYGASSTAAPAIYFLGRYSERHGNLGDARACYETLVRTRPNEFYALLARERLGAPEVARASISDEAARFAAGIHAPEAQAPPTSETHATTVRIERSRLLRAAGLGDLANAELRFGARTGAQPELMGLELGRNAEAPYLALRAMKAAASGYLDLRLEEAPRPFWEMLFPLPYRTELESGAHAQRVDPFLLAGLIRQESEFNPGALSHAHAYGLTQVLPVTARQFARRAGITRFTPRQLFQPATSLKIGTAVLRWMLEQNGGKLEQTLAAYNAGPRRAAEWAGWRTYREPAEFVESIPYDETRAYVQAVLRNADIYRRLYQ